MIKLIGVIVEKANLADGSSLLTIEMENGARIEHTLEREFARGAFDAGESVTISITQTAKQKKEVVDNTEPMESDETLALMNARSPQPTDGVYANTTGSKAKDATKPTTDSSAIAGTLGGASPITEIASPNVTTKSK